METAFHGWEYIFNDNTVTITNIESLLFVIYTYTHTNSMRQYFNPHFISEES